MSYVYFLRAKGTNFFKIGRTDQDVASRIAQLQTGCPYPIELYETVSTVFPAEMEKAFHDYLEGYRTSGEWFNVNPDMIDSLLAIPRSWVEKSIFSVELNRVTGAQIVLNSYSRDGDLLCIGARCVTYSELENECMRIIQSAMRVLRTVRQQKGDILVWGD